MKVPSLPVALAIFTMLRIPSEAALLVEYRFNDDSTTQSSGGTLADSAITIQGASAAIGGAGSGVSGQAGDLAFNNSAATAMGSQSTSNYRGVASDTTTDFSALGALTISGWFKADEVIGDGAVIFRTNQFSLRAFDASAPSTTGVIQLNVSGSNAPRSATTSSLFSSVNTWVYFAVTWDGTTIRYFQGLVDQAATQLGSSGAFSPTMSDPQAGLQIGNVAGSSITTSTTARIFDGYLDNIRVFDSALTQNELRDLQAADLANVPEPGSMALVVVGLACLGWRSLRTRRNSLG